MEEPILYGFTIPPPPPRLRSLAVDAPVKPPPERLTLGDPAARCRGARDPGGRPRPRRKQGPAPRPPSRRLPGRRLRRTERGHGSDAGGFAQEEAFGRAGSPAARSKCGRVAPPGPRRPRPPPGRPPPAARAGGLRSGHGAHENKTKSSGRRPAGSPAPAQMWGALKAPPHASRMKRLPRGRRRAGRGGAGRSGGPGLCGPRRDGRARAAPPGVCLTPPRVRGCPGHQCIGVRIPVNRLIGLRGLEIVQIVTPHPSY